MARSTRSWSRSPTTTAASLGKRFDAAFFLRVDRRRHPRLRLPAHRRHGDGAGARLRASRAGSRATATSTSCPTSRRCAVRRGPTARRSCCATSSTTRPRDLVRGGAAIDPASPGRAAGRARPRGEGGVRAGVLPLRRHLPRGARAGLRRTAAGRLVHRGLPPAAGQPRRTVRRRRPTSARRRRASRSRHSKGEWGRGQHELNIRYADVLDDGRPAHGHEARDEGTRRRDGHERHVHGQADHRRGRQQLPPPPQPVGRPTRARTCSRPEPPTATSFRWFLGGWMAHVDRLHGLLRTDGQLLQALRRRLVGADPDRLVARQPHRRVPGRRHAGRACASSAGSPAPTATRTSPTPRRSPAGSPASSSSIEPPTAFEGDVYQARRSPTGAAHPRARRRLVRCERRRSRGVRRTTSSTTTPTSIRSRSTPTTRPSPTGSARATSSGSETTGATVRLEGKIAVITGTAGGIGRAAALRFARRAHRSSAPMSRS